MKGWLGEGCEFPFAGGVRDVEGSITAVVDVGLGLADAPANIAGSVRIRTKGNRHLGMGKATQQPGRGIVVVQALARCGPRCDERAGDRNRLERWVACEGRHAASAPRQNMHISIQNRQKMTCLEADVHVWLRRWGVGFLSTRKIALITRRHTRAARDVLAFG